MASPQSDIFDGNELSPFWTFVDQQGNCSYSVSDGNLQITVAGGNSHDFWTSDHSAPRIEQPMDDVDFDIAVELADLPGFQIPPDALDMGMYVMDSTDTGWVRWDILAVGDGDNEFFLGRRSSDGGSASSLFRRATNSEALPYWLRLKRVGTTFAAYSSVDGEMWSLQHQFTSEISVAKCGLYAANTGDGDAVGWTADYNTFTNMLAPTEPEPTESAYHVLFPDGSKVPATIRGVLHPDGTISSVDLSVIT